MMPHESGLSLEAVVEIGSDNYDVPWALPNPPFPDFVALSGFTKPHRIGLAVAEMMRYADVGTGTPSEMFEVYALSEEVALGGGLILRVGEKWFAPECCVGMEGWREWYGLLDGSGQPWLGHNPDSGAEVVEERVVVSTHWPGPVGDLEVSITLDELASLLTGVQRDLKDFLGVMRNWAVRLAPNSAEAFVQAVDRNFGISQPRPDTPTV